MKVVSSPSIAARIELAFQSASTTTGADFGYLVKTAERESSFNVDAKAKTSSATGLFQFIESTWLETLKQSGAAHGLGDYANDITRRRDGKYIVSDPARRREILDLRKDPEVASLMAGEFTAKNSAYLEKRLGREPSNGELYIAHFLGANGASRLISMAESQPNARADTNFPRQAKANKSIFYTPSGKARSASDVYEQLVRKHDAPVSNQYAAVIAPGQAVPVPTAKMVPTSVAANTPVSGTVTNNVPFPGTRAEPLGGFAFLTQGVAELRDRLTTMQAAASRPVDDIATPRARPVALARARDRVAEQPAALTAQAVLAQGAGMATGLSAAPGSDQAAMLAAEDPNQFARLVASPAVAERQTDPGTRVANAWRATEPSTAFQALFRNDAAAPREPINPAYLSGFAAQSDIGQVGLFPAAASGRSDTAASELPMIDAALPEPSKPRGSSERASGRVAESTAPRGPLNLIGALRYQIFKEPEDLMPPA